MIKYSSQIVISACLGKGSKRDKKKQWNSFGWLEVYQKGETIFPIFCLILFPCTLILGFTSIFSCIKNWHETISSDVQRSRNSDNKYEFKACVWPHLHQSQDLGCHLNFFSFSFSLYRGVPSQKSLLWSFSLCKALQPGSLLLTPRTGTVLKMDL